MALAATTKSRRTQVPGSDMNDLLIQFNALAVDVQAIITAAATSLAAIAAVAPTAGKVGNDQGTAITT
jgi:hypothetical protein